MVREATDTPAPLAATVLDIESHGSGHDLVLLHGWGLHSEFFRPWLPLLTPHCRVHLVDLPGHGRNAPCDPYDLHTLAATIAAAMRPIAPRYAVLGWSLGGAVAQRLAIDHPAVVSHLITLASSPRFLRAPDWPHATTTHALELLRDGLRRDYAGTLAQFFSLNLAAKFAPLAATLDGLARARPAASAVALEQGVGLTSSVDLRAEVARIEAPVLALSGRLDRLSYSQSSAWLAAQTRGEHIDFAHAAHVPHLSEPQACADAVLAHLNTVKVQS